MKKVLSTFAALMICGATMVSLAGDGNGPFAGQIKTIRENKDVNKVADAIATIILNYEKATAEEIVTAYHAFEKFDGSKVDESKITTLKTEEDKDKFELYMYLCWERVKADNPELFKKENAAFMADPKSDGGSLDDVIEMAKALKHIKEEKR